MNDKVIDDAYVEDFVRAVNDAEADPGGDYTWNDDLPEDPGVPTAGDDVVAEIRD